MALLEIGRIVRPHGLSGEVVVALVTNRTERLAPGARLYKSDGPTGDGELTVVSSRPHKGRHLVVFSGVVGHDRAEELRDVVLFAESQPGDLYVHELIGSVVVDSDGTERGKVSAIEANPASDLLVIDEKFYVPLTFVVDQTPGRIVVEVPNGLFE